MNVKKKHIIFLYVDCSQSVRTVAARLVYTLVAAKAPHTYTHVGQARW